MGLYKECARLIKGSFADSFEDKSRNMDGLGLVEHREHLAVSDKMKKKTDSPRFYCSKVYYISDLHIPEKILQKFKHIRPSWIIKRYIQKIVQGFFTSDLCRDIQRSDAPIIIFGGDISSSYTVAKVFYTEFMRRWSEERSKSWRPNGENHIYAVLGNHELWDFDTLNDCCRIYRAFFHAIGIKLLTNNKIDLGRICIVGGTGFAMENERFNANQGLYKATLNREEEIAEGKKWIQVYNKARFAARQDYKMLIVVTHNPITDWKRDGMPDDNCFYFYGHTHRNIMKQFKEKNSWILADNQIGYKQCDIMQFKIAYITQMVNPFAKYSDGYHQICSEDYIKFYRLYLGESIQGNGNVDKQVNSGAKFYMIKHNGYYGFFVISQRAAFVCAGGRLRKIKEYFQEDFDSRIKWFDERFERIVDKYLEKFSTYRDEQERIANKVKRFGGTGNIHGCIIDIDYFNHIMLNPFDGTITYYFSPELGMAEIHPNLMSLLEDCNPSLFAQYRKQLSPSEIRDLIPTQQAKILVKTIEFSVKDSIYTVSNRMNQIQRLFTHQVLRDWNENILFDDTNLLFPRKCDMIIDKSRKKAGY